MRARFLFNFAFAIGSLASRLRRSAKVRFSILSPESRHSAYVKSFGRRQASESPRGTNPRCAGRGLWGFDVLAVPRWAAVERTELQRVRIARGWPGDHGQNPRRLIGHFGDRGGDGAPDGASAAIGAQSVDGRSDWATTWRGNEPCRVTTAPRLLRERGAARAAASSARRSR